ncbi:uncharacterized protein LOC116248093 isoform X1 [Nymphaea colorata]|nr:uncharacterized protein LOC116248093 isoform X1 [Nymphaea colorata]
MGEARIICRVCQKQFSQYTCPRCNARYCSLPCYKRHSLHCTESFMRENVMEELRHIQPEDETKRKMLELLKRFHLDELDKPFEIEIDKGDSLLSEDTIQKVLRGDAMSLDDLSNEEKKQFQRAVASGELGKLIEPWRPWWYNPSARTISLSREGAQLVQPIIAGESTSSGRGRENDPCDIPPGPEAPLQPLSELTCSDPSPLLGVHLVDIIYTYCFTLRLYNGEWQSDPLGASLVVLNMSSVLGEGGQPETVAEALAWCLEKTCSPAYRDLGGLHFGLGLFDDVVCLLYLGTPALVTMLCDLKRLIEVAIGEPKSKRHEKGKTNSRNRSKLRSTSKKVYFLLCWVHEQPREAWPSLAAAVELEKAAIVSSSSRDGRLNIQGKTGSNHKVLIEEV